MWRKREGRVKNPPEFARTLNRERAWFETPRAARSTHDRRRPQQRAPRPLHGRHGLHPAQAALAQTYQRLRAAGKAPKTAIIACMRKLITILNAILRDQKPWAAA
jgi:hypothetical protein